MSPAYNVNGASQPRGVAVYCASSLGKQKAFENAAVCKHHVYAVGWNEELILVVAQRLGRRLPAAGDRSFMVEGRKGLWESFLVSGIDLYWVTNMLILLCRERVGTWWRSSRRHALCHVYSGR